MEVKPIELKHQSKLMNDYRDRQESIYKHFEYDPFQLRSFKSRQSFVMDGQYQRETLVEVLKGQNSRWGMNEQVERHIDELLDERATVVIGGQQTGVLTGPLYTIHKIISIIIQAKEQREHLGCPVVPVFWMAGEDHDFLEIDHIFTYNNQRLNKVRVNDQQPFDYKVPISKRILPQGEVQQFIDDVFETFQETKYTKSVYQLVQGVAEKSETYVDFFAYLTQQLFASEGLVLVDADDKSLRKLERPYFLEMVEKRADIALQVTKELNELAEDGYHINLDASLSDAHLFYHHEGERLLLEVSEEGLIQSKGGEVSFSESEFKQLVYDHPEFFSNNVITRPLMQELVFPVLSFVGGPGEIAYWAALKGAFKALNLKLPIVTPRLSLTLMKRNHQSFIEQYQMGEEALINDGSYHFKMNWLTRQSKYPVKETVEEVKKQLEVVHQPLQSIAQGVSSDLEALTKTNFKQIEDEIDYVKKRIMSELKKQHEQTVKQFDELNEFYNPSGGLQERVWNIVYWLNEYGLDLPIQLTEIPPRWEQDHQFITL
ncbi:bacillithiol biosynthesis cysteine-adding enzyme BshC [Alkalibacillus filiformis]|uniref:Putative cysteine ligase BshC n=1 Tax=Alkalibacillus filiformis TaxID=200990 RepID=A0ABU0DQN3_9BACI|nr:bacillithiol biosynthesis cysteine-adding enzyme BshC [Alkalibacillus filiformis]MDQ0350515.1 bacillithiol biosynthesis cysteine-adding enzyme BshC [Alkalibacillus filiformis]